jgi:rhomboid family GlyGly-CTERM serine protease
MLWQLAGDAGRSFGRFDRSGLADGEAWRLLTGHLVHMSWGHFVMNVCGLAALSWVFSREIRAWNWLGIALVSAAAIDAGLYYGNPELQWYVGLSGILHGFWAAGALRGILYADRSFGALALAGLLGKLLFEYRFGPSDFTESLTGANVVTVAHAYGALGGALFVVAAALVQRVFRRRRRAPL